MSKFQKLIDRGIVDAIFGVIKSRGLPAHSCWPEKCLADLRVELGDGIRSLAKRKYSNIVTQEHVVPQRASVLATKGNSRLAPSKEFKQGRTHLQSVRKYNTQSKRFASTMPPSGQEKATFMKKYMPASAQQFLQTVKGPSNLQKALSLQLESFWDRHYRKIYVAGAVMLSWFIWRSMRMTASAFVNVSESLAVTGVSSLAATGFLLAAFWYYRTRFVISPSSVYRAAMMKLNSHPGVLEVMGAPVVGSDVRASVVTGGGLKLKGWRPKIRSRRVQMIFPLKGSERKGLVSLEAKKRKGKLRLSLLAVDVPLPASMGGEQRVYIEGGPKAYERGGVLNELRQPFLSALTSEEAAEADDEAEELEQERAERLNQSIAALDRESDTNGWRAWTLFPTKLNKS